MVASEVHIFIPTFLTLFDSNQRKRLKKEAGDTDGWTGAQKDLNQIEVISVELLYTNLSCWF